MENQVIRDSLSSLYHWVKREKYLGWDPYDGLSGEVSKEIADKGILKLLTIAPFYRFFVKDFVEAQSKYFDEINVLVHHNYLSELARYLPFSYFRHVERFSKKWLVDSTEIPENVKVHVISALYFVPDGQNQGLGDKLANLFKRYIERNNIEFDLVHAHFTWPSGYAGVKLGEKFNVPAVITIHENRDWLLREYNSKNRKIHWTWGNADALIRVNKRDITLLKEFNPNVFFVPNGFSPERLKTVKKESARESLGLPKDKKILFSLGALIERKGFNYLIQAMSEVIKHRKDVLCFIGGSGPLKGKLQKQINELGLQDHVKLLGFVPDDELYLWMNSADVFVLPSLSESFGLVQLEAMAVGTPVVATYNGGSEEIITSEDYGLLCPPKDSKCLAEKILTALERDWDRGKIIKYAEKFTWEKIAKQILEVYKYVFHRYR